MNAQRVKTPNVRGHVFNVCGYFTHVRTLDGGLLLFNHAGEAPAPVELRKQGTEVLAYEGDDILLRLKAAPPQVRIPQRSVPYDGVANRAQLEAEAAHAELAAEGAKPWGKKAPPPKKMSPEERADFSSRASKAINPPKIPIRGRG